MPEHPDLCLYINGTWRKTGQSLPVLNPAIDAVIGQVPLARKAGYSVKVAFTRCGGTSGSSPKPTASA